MDGSGHLWNLRLYIYIYIISEWIGHHQRRAGLSRTLQLAQCRLRTFMASLKLVTSPCSLSNSKVGEGLAGEHGGGHHTAEGEHGQTTVLQLLCP